MSSVIQTAMDFFAPISHITDLTNEDNIFKILQLSVYLRPDYWRKYTRAGMVIRCHENIGTFNPQGPEVVKKREALLKYLLRCINRAMVPPVAVLKSLEQLIVSDGLAFPILGSEEVLNFQMTGENKHTFHTMKFDKNGHTEFDSLVYIYELSLDSNGEQNPKIVYEEFNKKHEYVCAYCKKDAFSRCALCGVSYYCSKDHQTLDLADHKSSCKYLRFEKFSLSYLVARLENI